MKWLRSLYTATLLYAVASQFSEIVVNPDKGPRMSYRPTYRAAQLLHHEQWILHIKGGLILSVDHFG